MGNDSRPLGEHLAPGPEKVNLGAGRRHIKGFDNTDLFLGPGIDYRVDLLDLPLPWGENTLDMVLAIDVLEHIPHHVLGYDGDFFWHLINNILTCLKPGGILEVHTPHWKSPDALSVPDHLRIVGEHTFRPWRDEFPSSDARALDAINGSRLDLVEKRVGRYLQVGPLSDYHFRKYLHLEVGHPCVYMQVFRVRK